VNRLWAPVAAPLLFENPVAVCSKHSAKWRRAAIIRGFALVQVEALLHVVDQHGVPRRFSPRRGSTMFMNMSKPISLV